MPNDNSNVVHSSKERTYDLVIKYTILIAVIALLTILCVKLISSDDLKNMVPFCGIILAAIFGLILIAILKNQLDRSESEEQQVTIMNILLSVFRIFKGNKNYGGQNNEDE